MCLTVHVLSLGHVNIVSWSLFVIGSCVITHLFCLYCSHVIILVVCGWPHSVFDWPCASLSLISNCVPDHEIIIRCLSPGWSLSFLCISVLLTYRSLLLFCFVPFSVLFSLFLCFSFLTKFESPNEENHRTGCRLPLADKQWSLYCFYGQKVVIYLTLFSPLARIREIA